MKVIIVALAVVAVAAAASVGTVYKEPPKILRYDFEQQPEGNYVVTFETEDGIKREETGEVKLVVDGEKGPQAVVIVRGSYSYINDQGEDEVINYYADESGFHAEGKSIPKQR